MAAAGVALEFDLTSHAVIGLGGLLNKLPVFCAGFAAGRPGGGTAAGSHYSC